MKTRQEIESIARQKKRLRAMLIFAVALVMLIGAAVALIVYFMTAEPESAGKPQPPEVLEGEALYNNTYTLAYPTVDDKDITRITINNVDEFGERREYVLYRHEDAQGDFLFSYMENGEVKIYYPSILSLEADFEYSDLYAKETEDGYGTIDKIMYLLAALETPYFGERIVLSDNEAERNEQLRLYGFSADDPIQTIEFDYDYCIAGAETETTDDDKYEKRTHRITIGDGLIVGTGYYYMVDGRNYVYSSNSNYFDYALLGFHSFIKGMLVAEGLEDDSSFEPTLTSDFTHLKNEMHKEGEVVEDSRVVVFAEMTVPVDPHKASSSSGDYGDGYVYGGYSDVLFDLKTSYEPEIKTLLGQSVGTYDDGALSMTVISATNESKRLAFSFDDTAEYLYEIYAVEAIVNVEGEDGSIRDINTPGTVVGDNNFVKISYKFGDNEAIVYDNFMCHAVLDLSHENVPDDVEAALRAATVGEAFDEPLVMYVLYTPENAFKLNIQLKITEILSIFDEDGRDLEKVKEDSIVAFRYKTVVNGVEQEKEETNIVNLGTDDSSTGKEIKKKLVGEGLSNKLNIVFYDNTDYFETVYDFYTYNISEIKYFVTSEEIVSFKYLNNSERDPFYGESIYDNMTDGYELYGLNSSICEGIVKILGGVADGNSTSSAGLAGETLTIGITPEKMEHYGLYEHTLRFEVPRGIITIDSGADDVVDDYSSYGYLTMTLYISEENSDGTRNVGSDVFDLIAKVDGSLFSFLDENFVDYWARRNLVLTNVANLEGVDLEFSMSDLVGRYEFNLNHQTGYVIVKDDGKMGMTFTEPEDYVDSYDYITVYAGSYGECTETELSKFLEAQTSSSNRNLTAFYNEMHGDGKLTFVENSYDALGTGCFKDLMRTLFFVEYEGSMTDEEQQQALDEGARVMKFSFKIGGTSYKYSYEFYRCDDRRVLVRLYQEGSDGAIESTAVSDFYISTFGFKKIVSTFLCLLNGEIFNLDNSYND